jgi:DNA-binding Lrp family transcriptional regulator
MDGWMAKNKLDIQIAQLLKENGRISLTAITKETGYSRPTVTSHLNKLLKEGDVIITGGYDIGKLGYKMASAGLEVKSDNSRREFIQLLRSCPRVQSIFRIPDKANIHVGIWGEDDQTIESTLESFRDFPGVNVVEINFLGTPIYGKIPITVGPFDNDVAPCGKVCSECLRFKNSWCYGCPVTSHSRSPLSEG